MQNGDRSADQLKVAIHDDVAYVRLLNRGSFKVSKAMKQFGLSAIERGLDTIVVDLSDCVGMDSTFMGVMAGLAFRMNKENQGRLYMVNLSPRTRGLLSTLGLDQLVDTHMAGSTPPQFEAVLAVGDKLQELNAEESSRRETAEMMLEAHEDLVDVTPENLPRFKDVLTFLREDIKKADADPDGQAGD